MYSEEYKQQVYKNWIARNRPWFDIDKSKEPSYAERQIILEMKKRENTISKPTVRPKPKNEIKEFHRLFTDISSY